MPAAPLLSLYAVTVPSFLRGLKHLRACLAKGEAHGGEALVQSKLIEDMGNLAFQVQRASDTANGLAVRVGAHAPVSMPDTEATFADLYGRIDKTIQVLQEVKESEFGAHDDKEVVIHPGLKFSSGTEYALKHALPNFDFHVSIAYAILRKDGVPVGKDDFMGRR